MWLRTEKERDEDEGISPTKKALEYAKHILA
jgi:hypothetical protein